MAATVVVNHSFVTGDRLRVIADVTFDSSYPSLGYPFAPSLLGLTGEVDYVNLSGGMITTVVYDAFYDYVNQKIRIVTGVAEVSGSLAGLVMRVDAVGKGFPVSNV
jgi:hypothetical protein